MRRAYCLVGLLLLCGSVASGQTVTMPQSVPVSIGRLASVTMTYDGTDFAYSVPPELDAFREYGTTPNEVRLRVIGYTVGTFRITAVTCKGDKLSPFQSCLVLVSGPGPTPIPPTPPVPVPPGPSPVPIPPVDTHPLTQFRAHPLAPEVGAATLAFATVLKAHPLATIGEFKAKLTEFYNLAFSVPNSFPGFSVALESAFVTDFGRDDGPLDATKANTFLITAAAALGVR